MPGLRARLPAEVPACGGCGRVEVGSSCGRGVPLAALALGSGRMPGRSRAPLQRRPDRLPLHEGSRSLETSARGGRTMSHAAPARLLGTARHYRSTLFSDDQSGGLQEICPQRGTDDLALRRDRATGAGAQGRPKSQPRRHGAYAAIEYARDWVMGTADDDWTSTADGSSGSRRVWYTLFQERHLGVKILMSIVTTPGASSL